MTRIIPLTTEDNGLIIDLWEASVRQTHHFLKPSEIDFYRPLILKYALPQNSLFGIREQKLQAFIGIIKPKIEMLFVHPNYFRQGLGSSLLSYAVETLKCNLVDVNEENPAALKFYQQLGFRILSRDEFDDCGKPHPILHLIHYHQ